MNAVVHFEIPAADVGRARKFYASTFGWQIADMPAMDYVMVSTTPVGENQRPTEPGAINGGMMKREGIFQTPVLVIDVPDVKAAAARVTAAGGQMVKDPFPVGEMGIAAYFKDPEGNVLGLWQSLRR